MTFERFGGAVFAYQSTSYYARPNTYQHGNIGHDDGVIFGAHALFRVESVDFLLVVRERSVVVELDVDFFPSLSVGNTQYARNE